MAGALATAGLLVAALVVPTAPIAHADEVVPGLAPRTPAGRVEVLPTDPRQPSAKTVDGDPSDWIGTRTDLGGSVLQSAGELIVEDHLFDAHGADDGTDVLLAGLAAPLIGIVPSLDRPLRQGPVLAGLLTNGVVPGSRPMRIGDAITPPGRTEAADLDEVRVAPAPTGSGLLLLTRTAQLRTADETAVLVLLDLPSDGDADASSSARPIPFGSSLSSNRAELAALITSTSVQLADLRTGSITTSVGASVDPDGPTNAIEAVVPLPAGVEPGAIAFAAGYADAAGTGLVDVGPGSAPTIVDVAPIREPVSASMDESQALLLATGNIDGAFTPLDLTALRAGATDRATPGPGYHDAKFTSTTPGVAIDDLPRQGARQSYGLFLPSSWRPGTTMPTTLWLHYGGGDTHHLSAFLPNMVRSLGEERDNVLVSPSGRGEYSFFGGAGYADVFEALADSDRFGRDPDRTSLAGYSMGSYGTMLLATLHPDLWAGALAIDGTPPSFHDGWTQNLTNAAPVPFTLMGLLAYTQMKPDYDALRGAGATARMYLYPTDHYSNIAIDHWAQLTDSLGQPVRDTTPERVRYTRVPAIERGVATGTLAMAAKITTNPAVVPVDADGAFWVDGIEVRSGDPASLGTVATVDATTDGHGHEPREAEPELAVSLEGAATPFVMEGVRHRTDGQPSPRADTFAATLTNVAAVRFDLIGMGMCDGATAVGRVTTDGPVTVRFVGRPGDEVTVVELSTAGTHEVRATCGVPLATLPATGDHADPIAPLLLLVLALGALSTQRQSLRQGG